MADLVRVTEEGLYCEQGDFYIDPWRPVPRTLITHAHSDHACPGCRSYLTAGEGQYLLQSRMGPDADVETLPYGQTVTIKGVRISFHPAGHVLGSAQIRLEAGGEVWVISGDYKTVSDRTNTPFEPIPCDTFVSECTFGLPIYRWPAQEVVFEDINHWWRANREAGRVSLVFAYALGKAQRVLAGIDPSVGPIFCHGAVERVNDDYRKTGIKLPETSYSGTGAGKRHWDGGLVLAPPSTRGSPWMRKFGPLSSAFVSGWMQIRGARRRRAVDRGFVLSDHADWPGLLTAIRETGATRILLTHGRTDPMVRWLREAGWDAAALPTAYIGERDDVEVDSSDFVAEQTTDADLQTGPESSP